MNLSPELLALVMFGGLLIGLMALIVVGGLMLDDDQLAVE